MPMLRLGTDVGGRNSRRQRTRKLNAKPRWKRLGPPWIASMRTGGSLGHEGRGLQEGNLRARALRPRPNDPCPCGSGRKFKKCCAAESAG